MDSVAFIEMPPRDKAIDAPWNERLLHALRL